MAYSLDPPRGYHRCFRHRSLPSSHRSLVPWVDAVGHCQPAHVWVQVDLAVGVLRDIDQRTVGHQ